MRPVVVGAAVGLLASIAASSLLTLLLFGISRFDPVAYIAVVVFLMSVALLASYLPARRALRIDPMAAIRHE
jgi:ABC-type antimicrobial peptide transport system permease subunit